MKITKITPITKNYKLANIKKQAQSAEDLIIRDAWNKLVATKKIQFAIDTIRTKTRNSTSSIVNIITGTEEPMSGYVGTILQLAFNTSSIYNSGFGLVPFMNLAGDDFGPNEMGLPEEQVALRKFEEVLYGQPLGLDEDFFDKLDDPTSGMPERKIIEWKTKIVNVIPQYENVAEMGTSEGRAPGTSHFEGLFKAKYGNNPEMFKQLFSKIAPNISSANKLAWVEERFQNWKNFLKELAKERDESSKDFYSTQNKFQKNIGIKTPQDEKHEAQTLKWLSNDAKRAEEFYKLAHIYFVEARFGEETDRYGGFLDSKYDDDLFKNYWDIVESFKDPFELNEDKAPNMRYIFSVEERFKKTEAAISKLEALPKNTSVQKREVAQLIYELIPSLLLPKNKPEENTLDKTLSALKRLKNQDEATILWFKGTPATKGNPEVKGVTATGNTELDRQFNMAFYKNLSEAIVFKLKPILNEIRDVNQKGTDNVYNKILSFYDGILKGQPKLIKTKTASELGQAINSQVHRNLIKELKNVFVSTPRVVVLTNLDKSVLAEEQPNGSISAGPQGCSTAFRRTKEKFGKALGKWGQLQSRKNPGETLERGMIAKKVIIFPTSEKVDVSHFKAAEREGGITYIDLKHLLSVDADMVRIIVEEVCKDKILEEEVLIRASIMDKLCQTVIGSSIAKVVGIAQSAVDACKDNLVEINKKKFINPKCIEGSFKNATTIDQSSKLMVKRFPTEGQKEYVKGKAAQQEMLVSKIFQFSKYIMSLKGEIGKNLDSVQDLQLELDSIFKDLQVLEAEGKSDDAKIEKSIEIKQKISDLEKQIENHKSGITGKLAKFTTMPVIVLHGPPGSSKTLIARMTAKELGFEYYELNLRSSADPLYGASLKAVEEEFAKILNMNNVIINLEELDGTGFMKEKASTLGGAAENTEKNIRNAVKIFFDVPENILKFKKQNIIFYGCTNHFLDLDEAIGNRVEPIEVGPVISPETIAKVFISCVQQNKQRYALDQQSTERYENFQKKFEALGEQTLGEVGAILLEKMQWKPYTYTQDSSETGNATDPGFNFRKAQLFMAEIWQQSDTYDELAESHQAFVADKSEEKTEWQKKYVSDYNTWVENGRPKDNPFVGIDNWGMKLTKENLLEWAHACSSYQTTEQGFNGRSDKVALHPVSGTSVLLALKNEQKKGKTWTENDANQHKPSEEVSPKAENLDLFNPPAEKLDDEKDVFKTVKDKGAIPATPSIGGTKPTQGTQPTEATNPTEDINIPFKKDEQEKAKQQKKIKEEQDKTKTQSSTDYFYDTLKKQGALPTPPNKLSINHPTINLNKPPVAPVPVAQTPVPVAQTPVAQTPVPVAQTPITNEQKNQTDSSGQAPDEFNIGIFQIIKVK